MLVISLSYLTFFCVDKKVLLEFTPQPALSELKVNSFNMPLVENFLCFDLSTGGFAIGTFEIILHTFFVAFSGFRLTHVNDSGEKKNVIVKRKLNNF